jgi:hypothetical protein
MGLCAMYTQSTSRLLAAAALTATLFTGAVLAEEQVKSSEIPTDAYYGTKLTPDQKAGIASEENVTPNDGKPSVPPPDVQGVIPDAADPESGDSTVADPSNGALPGDTKNGKTAESEPNVILNDAKKNFHVSRKEYDDCLSQWGPDSQMTKQEWASSCRTTLQYFPEGGN